MKRIFSFMLSLMLCISMLVGCGADKKPAEAPAKNSTTVTTTTNNKQQVAKPAAQANSSNSIREDGTYTDKDRVAAYINQYNKLPKNYITKQQAKALGWQTKGTLDKVAPGKSIGGDRYGDYEGKLPKKSGRRYTECDIDYVKGNRNAKRIIFSNDGLIFYTGDHYKTFTKIYEGKKKL